MKRLKKSKIVSIILALTMLFSSIPMNSIGANETEATLDETFNVTVNYTNAARLLMPVFGQSLARWARNSETSSSNRLDSTGIVTNKSVEAVTADSLYKIILEAYVTGSTITSTEYTDVPTDIIFVLDQSGSMDTEDMETVVSYKVVDGRVDALYLEDVYVNLGTDDDPNWTRVTITPNGATQGYTYEAYTVRGDELPSNEQLYDAQEDDKIQLYYQVNSEYYPVTVKRSRNQGNRSYSYSYTYENAAGNEVAIDIENDKSDERPGVIFYTQTETIVYSSYTFSYTDLDGETQSETFDAGSNISANKYYVPVIGDDVSRLEALQNAVENFTDAVYAKAKGVDGVAGTADDVNHRIAMVGFANCDNYENYNNTELFIGATGYKYGSITEANYAAAFQNMNTVEGYNNVVAAKNALDADGATYVDLGIEIANNILAANPVAAGTVRNRVVIVLTDGTPGYSGEWGTDSYTSTNQGNGTTVANEAISQAYITKNTYGATVFTIGIFPGADATDFTENGNKFMHYVSSNYKNARSMTNSGTSTAPGDGSSYYLSADNTEDLSGIFQQISNSVQTGGASITLDETTVVSDIVSPYFSIPDSATVSLYTADYNGDDASGIAQWKDKVTATFKTTTYTNESGVTTLDVSGFDFSENYVGYDDNNGTKTARGKKLIIEFTVAVNEDFLGGNGVPTNGEASGIYDSNGILVENFVLPAVDITVKPVENEVVDKYIYYTNETDLLEIIQFDERINGVNNAYVDIEYTIAFPDNTVATYLIPRGAVTTGGTWTSNNTPDANRYLSLDNDATYSVTCVVDGSNENGENNKVVSENTATIYVFKPELTFEDSSAYYGEAVPDFVTNNYVSETWKNGSTLSTNVDMEGTKPVLTLNYNLINESDIVAGIISAKRDIPVDVIVTVSGKIISSEVTFVHEDCVQDEELVGGKFLVHVKVKETSLTIQKETFDGEGNVVDYKEFDKSQTFIFNVTGVDSNTNSIKNVLVTVHGSGSITITGLPIGEYIITEVSDWSWRYQYSGVTTELNNTTVTNGIRAELSVNADDNVITFHNTRAEEQWLDGDSYCVNEFTGNNVTK